MKNHARLPRTAGMRTITEMSEALTKAGLDPSRIEERAAVLAKAQGAKRKRQREEDEAGMDVDMDDEGEGEWMDVDEGDGTPNKRKKTNVGTAVVARNKREPRTNRQLAGMRDDAVRNIYFSPLFLLIIFDLTASIKSGQIAQPWSARAEHACESWRRRSRDQNQNGQ